MNICICVNTLGYAMGGVSTHIIDLCKQYSAREDIDKIIVLLIVLCDGGELVNLLGSISKVQYFRIPFDQTGFSIKGIISNYKLVNRIVKSEKIDIVHIHSQRILPIGYLIKLFSGIPYLWTNHIDAIPEKRVFKLMCKLMRFPIISVSQELRNMMMKEYGCNGQYVYVVNNGIDLDDFNPLSQDETALLETKYGIDRKNKPYVISLLSRITPIKGHMVLLKAIADSPYKEKIKVIFAGHTYPTEEQYKYELQSFSEMQGIDLTFLDYSKPRDVFGVSDLFVLPSLYEGFPLVCIEALAMKCAVLRSRTPGWQELEDYVGIFEKNDVNRLRELMNESIENDFYPEKTNTGYMAVKSRFTKETCAAQTINVYRKLIN